MSNIYNSSSRYLLLMILLSGFFSLSACTFEATSTKKGKISEGSLSINSGIDQINSSNQSGVIFSGNCNMENSLIEVLIDDTLSTISATCSAGTWSLSLDLTNSSEASHNFVIRMTPSAGGTPISTAPVALVKDITDPEISSVIFSDGIYHNSLTQSPLLTWTAATDAGSGVIAYEIAIGTSSGGTQLLNWTSVGNVLSYQAADLTLADGQTYYASLRAKDTVGNSSTVILGDGWTVDMIAPTAPGSPLAASLWFSATEAPTASWSASTDTGPGLSHYLLAVGSTAGGTDVLSWTNIGNVLSFSASSLTLTLGNSYYISVKSVDLAGNQSAVTIFSPWVYSQAKYIVDPTATTNNADINVADFICADVDGKCSLAAALDQQLYAPFDFVIEIPTGTYTFTNYISINKLDLTKKVTLSGADTTNSILNGDNVSKIFRIGYVGPIIIENLKFQNGVSSEGMGGTGGGAIFDDFLSTPPELTIKNCLFQDNTTNNYGGAISFRWGHLSLVIKNSTFTGNSATGSADASVIYALTPNVTTIEDSYFYNNLGYPVIYISHQYGAFNLKRSSIVNNTGTAIDIDLRYNLDNIVSNIEDSTIARNTGTGVRIATTSGLGITSGDFIIRNSTIAENFYGSAGTGRNLSINWGTYTTGKFQLVNSITSLANPVTQANCTAGSGTREAYNSLVENGTGACTWTTSSGLITALPQLNALADHGGAGLSMLPLITSPTINAGDNAMCTATDQAGVSRPIGGTCDMGALETNY